jgi:hypothetical protein
MKLFTREEEEAPTGFIAKPFNWADVVQKVEKMLNR